MIKSFANLRIRTKLLLSYGVVILCTLIASSFLAYNVSKRAITEHAMRQNSYSAGQLAINLSAQFQIMEDVQFSQYYYSQLGDFLALAPDDPIDRANLDRKINDALNRLSYAKAYINGACVVDNSGRLHSVNVNRDFDIVRAAQAVDTLEISARRARPVWEVSEDGQLLMSRQLINVNSTKVVGMITVMIDPKLVTQVFEKDASLRIGDIVLYDQKHRTLPVTSAEAEAVAAKYIPHEADMGQDALFDSDGARYIIAHARLPGNDFTLLNIVSIRSFDEYTRYLPWITAAMASVIVLLAATLAKFTSDMVTKNIRHLVEGIRRFAGGTLDAPVAVSSRDEIGYLCMEFNRMAQSIRTLIDDVYAAQTKKRTAELNALQFEYNALEAKINPHFLYNTLESVNSMAKLKGDNEISEIVCLLGKLLRDNISATADIIPLAQELQNIETYLRIQKLTYGDKFSVDIRLDDDTATALVPKFILQPLVENAIMHGIMQKKGKGLIELHASKIDDRLCIELSDDGTGISKSELDRLLDYSVEAQNDSGTHAKVGVRAVDKRLKILYGKTYGLTIESEQGRGTRILIAMPFNAGSIREKGDHDDQSSGDR